MSHIDVAVDGLRRHAGRIEEISDEITYARAAAAQVAVETDAYGKLCAPILLPTLNLLEERGLRAMRVAAAMVDATAGGVRRMAGGLDVADSFASRAVEEVRR
ncbi:hypothetical protein ACK8GG_20750 [Micromonosporaceae bacterium DT55]|uniref:hypothetical protein n=1 Tax=Melissospora conviva TaxID=3388432 RepID=UPI003C25ED0B